MSKNLERQSLENLRRRIDELDLELLKLLNERGFKFRGKRFKGWNIRDILNNEFYIGIMKYGDITSESKYPKLVSKRLFNQVCIG